MGLAYSWDVEKGKYKVPSWEIHIMISSSKTTALLWRGSLRVPITENYAGGSVISW
jgi:hypothetical protein